MSVLRIALLMVLLLGVGALSACSTTTLKGVVTAGEVPGVFVVSENDDRLNAPPVERAQVELLIDPNSFNELPLGTVMTFSDGTFETSLEEVDGAGFLEYELRVTAMAGGYTSVREVVDLPGQGKRLLIVLGRGGAKKPAGWQDTQDVLEESLRYGRESGYLKD